MDIFFLLLLIFNCVMIKLPLHEYEDMKKGRKVKNFVSKDRFTFNSMLSLYRFSHLSAYIDAILKLIPASSTETVVMVKIFL